jgi:ADP-heptose:LPS heptosyltransferase
MKLNIKKYYYKLFDNKKYRKLKQQKAIQKTVEIFENKYRAYLYEIESKIKNNKKINFLHSGHLGDLIYALPVVKELAKDHICHFYIQTNKKMFVEYYKHPSGNVFIDDRMLNLFLPLMKEQKFIHKVEKYNDQEIDVNLDIFRELPVNILFNSPRWYFHITGVQVDLSEPYLDVLPHEKIKNKIVILRTFRGRSQFVNYKFLENYKDLIFIGLKNEYDDLKQDVKNLEFYDCKDFLDMARIIKACKFFIGNKSVAYALAEGMKVPRILEAEPPFPVVQPIGKNAFDFYYQPHFEKWCKYFNDKN